MRARDDDAPRTYTQLITTGYASDNEHFIQMLADAVKATIIGITNENLTPMLEEAVRRKRAGGRPDAFWESLRIVFLDSSLLAAINDEREDMNDQQETLRQRREDWYYADKAVRTFLRKTYPSHWELFVSPYYPQITGAFLEFPNHRKIAHLLIRRSRSADTENLYIDLADDQERFRAVFEDIVRNGKSNYIVPVGVPEGQTFYWNRRQLASKVLRPESDGSGWLPMVMVITYRRNGGRLEPVMQLRTEDNSARELYRFSHLSGHITTDDCGSAQDGNQVRTRSFDLHGIVPRRAARRRILEVIGLEDETMRAETAGTYLYGNMEHLFFFVFSLELANDTHVSRRAQMFSVPLRDLLSVRANQVLRSAIALCELPKISDYSWALAAEVLACNLILHDQARLADQLLAVAGGTFAARAETAAQLRARIDRRVDARWTTAGVLEGLAGFQHRAFFTALLTCYVTIGIDEADRLMDAVNNDSRKREARARLAELYNDEQVISAAPLEI